MTLRQEALSWPYGTSGPAFPEVLAVRTSPNQLFSEVIDLRLQPVELFLGRIVSGPRA